jgi:hypothetical protein
MVRTSAGALTDEEVIRGVASRLAASVGERDQRPKRVRQAIDRMLAVGALQRPVPGQLGVTRAVALTDEDGEEEWTS